MLRRIFAFSLVAAALSAQTVIPNVEYSNVGARMEMDIVKPDHASGPLPAVLFVHGGGFRRGTRQGYLELAKKLAVAVT